jgi:two-component system OmpR family response regulator
MLEFADLVMDEDAREVRRAGSAVELTPTEFELLRYFLRHPRQVLSKAQIIDSVFEQRVDGDSNVVETFVGYLRRKVDDERPPLIHTVREQGYVLRAPDER